MGNSCCTTRDDAKDRKGAEATESTQIARPDEARKTTKKGGLTAAQAAAESKT